MLGCRRFFILVDVKYSSLSSVVLMKAESLLSEVSEETSKFGGLLMIIAYVFFFYKWRHKSSGIEMFHKTSLVLLPFSI